MAFDSAVHPRSVDGTFAVKPRDETGALDLMAVAVGSGPDRGDSTTWPYDFPERATYEELPGLVEDYYGGDHFRMPEIEGATFALTHNFLLTRVGAPSQPEHYAEDADDEEEADWEAEAVVEGYVCLQETMAERPWDVPPLVVVAWGDDLESALEQGEYELIDGNHRAGLGLGTGVKQHPAYVLLCPEREWGSPPPQAALPYATSSAATVMGDHCPTDGVDWASLRVEYETEHPVVMAALREDMAEHGMRTPVVVRDGKVENGQHRVLVAADLGIAVKWRQWRAEDGDPATKHYWDPETREHYGPDEDEHDEGQRRY